MTKQRYIDKFMSDDAMVEQFPSQSDRLIEARKALSKRESNVKNVLKVLAKLLTDGRSEELEDIKESLIGPQGEKGTDGNPGRDGRDGTDASTPVVGEDYFTSEDIEFIKEDLLGRIKVPTPKLVKETINNTFTKEISEAERLSILNELFDALSREFPKPTAKDIKEKLESLTGDARLSAKAIKDLPRPRSGGPGRSRGNVFFWGIFDSEPSPNAFDGDLYYNSTESAAYIYISAAWVLLGSADAESNKILVSGTDALLVVAGTSLLHI